MFKELCDQFILIGHTKDKLLIKKGEELTNQLWLFINENTGDIDMRRSRCCWLCLSKKEPDNNFI